MIPIYLIVAIVAYLLFDSSYFKDFIKVKPSPSPTNQTLGITAPLISIPTISSPNLTPSPKPTNKAYIDPDPIISCTYPHSGIIKVRQSQCSSKYTDCGFINGTWKVMSKDECTKEQAADTVKNSSGTKSNTYNYVPYIPPVNGSTDLYMTCNLYDAKTNQTTYQYIKVTDCNNLMSAQYDKNTAYLNAQQQYNNDLQEACNNIKSAWNDYKHNFNTSHYNSSADAIVALTAERDYYQQRANAAGCTVYLSVY